MWIFLELVLIFVLLPISITLEWLTVGFILIPLYLVIVYAAWRFCRTTSINWGVVWRGYALDKEKRQLKIILLRFVLVSIVLGAILKVFFPDHLFDFPLNNTVIWVFLVVFYPVLSVIPQEFLYRAYFFQRYQSLFGIKWGMVVASSICFGFMHIVFSNHIAVILTLLGSLLFSHTYQQTQSLRLVSFEHAIYGQLLFTMGYGEFLLYGNELNIFKNIIS